MKVITVTPAQVRQLVQVQTAAWSLMKFMKHLRDQKALHFLVTGANADLFAAGLKARIEGLDKELLILSEVASSEGKGLGELTEEERDQGFAKLDDGVQGIIDRVEDAVTKGIEEGKKDV